MDTSLDPLKMKQSQVDFMIKNDHETNIRLWAVNLCQFISVSRFDDIMKWCLKDLHSFVLSPLLPNVGCMEIPMLLATQYTAKGKKVSIPY